MALTAAEEAQTRTLIAQQAALLALAAEEPAIISNLGAVDVSLSDLAAAPSLGDSDLLLVRQGVTDKSIAGSVIKAAATVADASETVKGIVELATVAETQAGTDAARAVTPAGLESMAASETLAGLIEIATDAEARSFAANKAIDGAKLNTAFQGANQSLMASGYQKLPGGLIIQWGSTASITGSVTVTLPIAFPTAFLAVSAQGRETSLSEANNWNVSDSTLANFKINNGGISKTFYYIAIGY